VPGQQGGRGDDPVGPQSAGEQPGQGGEDRQVRSGQTSFDHLTAQHRDLVAQDEDLGILGSSLPNNLIVIRHNSQNTTAHDHGMITYCH